MYICSIKANDILLEIENDTTTWINNVAGWEAYAKDDVLMIIFHQGKYTFSKNGNVYRIYKTKMSFAIRVAQLIKKGY